MLLPVDNSYSKEVKMWKNSIGYCKNIEINLIKAKYLSSILKTMSREGKTMNERSKTFNRMPQVGKPLKTTGTFHYKPLLAYYSCMNTGTIPW